MKKKVLMIVVAAITVSIAACAKKPEAVSASYPKFSIFDLHGLVTC